jgi:AraC-like DNA-binding protein
MDLADAALLAPAATLASVARQVGYGTEFAFSDAFKRHHGITPGRWRREQLAVRMRGTSWTMKSACARIGDFDSLIRGRLLTSKGEQSSPDLELPSLPP